ncbi:hypothetical protein FG386_001658 [Cryptosporidium ryanae]|uniref:uncharacterized protein n=1 Tax=Cryptosporidium ryanae TaxID=515981 RepID=UPI00351A1959|nr:hypothetical protein FG386_001658 [Cryptosporidium ryanae]
MIIGNILILTLIYVSFSLGSCFISSFSSPVVFVYSIIRTIDGMEENIKHISNSMDLSLQNFLSNHVFDQRNEALLKPLTINADYHGTISPYEMNFKPTLSTCRFNKEFMQNINSNISLAMYQSQNYTLFTFNNSRFDVEVENLLSVNNNDKHREEILKKMYKIGILDKYNDDTDPYYNHTQMVETTISQGKNFVKGLDLVNTDSMAITSIGKEMSDSSISTPFSLRYYGNEDLFKSSLYDSSNGMIDIEEFKYHTYYISHYTNQLISLFAIGISLRFFYTNKSIKRKLSLVK